MNILAHCENVKAAIAGDAALFAWCQATYSANPHVYGMMDERMPTTGKDYTPMIMVEKRSESEGHELMEKRYVLLVGFMVRQPEKVSVSDTLITEGGDTLITEAGDTLITEGGAVAGRTDLQGEGELENFRRRIKNAITGMAVVGAFLERVESSWEPMETWPFFKGYMECEWSEFYAQGDAVFS